jgi:hypothetical protein
MTTNLVAGNFVEKRGWTSWNLGRLLLVEFWNIKVSMREFLIILSIGKSVIQVTCHGIVYVKVAIKQSEILCAPSSSTELSAVIKYKFSEYGGKKWRPEPCHRKA